MATWNTRGLRGSTLEDMVNRTNEKYAEAGLALIQKIPTPLPPSKWIKQPADHTGFFRAEEYRRLHRCRAGNPCMLLMPRNVP